MDDLVSRLHREAPLTDIHAHPSLKAFLFRRNLWRHYRSGSLFNPFSSRSDFEMLSRGGVRTLWASHHLPERQLFSDCALLSAAALVFTAARVRLTRGDPFDRLLQMMDAFEREIGRRPEAIAVARTAAEVDALHARGRIAIVHTIEGAHPLEGDSARLGILAKRGVAMLTLNHFYHNGISTQVDGMPADLFIRRLCSFRFGQGSAPILTDFGRELLSAAERERVIVDITHCSPEARALVFSEVDRRRPLIASHVGAKALNADPYNLSDEEIAEVAATGGLIGVIAMPYWLVEDHGGVGALALVDTMEHVASVTGSWEFVAIGSDFDGFTEPPADLADASSFGTLTRLLLERGVSESDILGILGRNATRVLRRGWR